MKNLLSILFLLASFWVSGQSYTSYFTGNVVDTNTTPSGGVCLMGGAAENNQC